MRGEVHQLPDGGIAIVTIHPSLLLRIRDSEDKKRQYESFVADLAQARDLAGANRKTPRLGIR
jgi:DNA polymerase